ncbi:abnormal spindle-like microcephaly-associated protein homolog isoform X2 [Branchiostoma floridae]|uniref:Abnormal spindle-like microcephaly-associated protein homolog isoform X2 n=1 Tax=Branchiostoma floridae TaxID=7739 RepID=A0A9J7LHY6_BRAFL|nr:abnormal spindle-like microcephaly-associated protein homolog isoform X2 [Branchiostoma floridae]
MFVWYRAFFCDTKNLTSRGTNMDGSGECAADVRGMTWFDPWDGKGTMSSPSEETGEELPVLQLTNFAVTPRIGFGVVRVGETQTRKLLLHNPEPFPVTVVVEKLPRAKGYSVDLTEVEVQAAEDIVVTLQWTPGEECNSRALLGLKLDNAFRLHVILYGRAVVPVVGRQKRAKRRVRPREAVRQGSSVARPGPDAAPDTDGENIPPDQPDIGNGPQVKHSHSTDTSVEQGNKHPDVSMINSHGSTDVTKPSSVQKSKPASVQKTKRILQQSTVTKRRQNFGKSSEDVRIKAAKKELFCPPNSDSDQPQQQLTNIHSSGSSTKSGVRVQSQTQETPLDPGKPLVLRSAVSKNKVMAANKHPQKELVKRGDTLSKKSQAVKVKSTQVKNQVGTSGTTRSKPKVAKSKLCLVNTSKRQESVPAHHYMPYVSKNMYYDERWMQKQERAFIQWLNFILIPNTMVSQPRRNGTAVQMCEYAVLCNLNQLRRAACLLFQSEPMARVIHRLEEEVETGRLQVRADRHLHADQGIRQAILDMLLSYSPLWLRIGLETIFGEVLPLQHNDDVAGLSRFLLNRVLGNSDIAQQFSHPTVPHMYKTGYAAALAKFTLKKFLTLVFFMDRAKLTRLIDQDPCLFCIHANIKSSKELLLTFSREYLSGEGDVTRHLSFLGYSVTHQQTALMEMDYTVQNLATDLRDGLRLSRAVELLTKNWTLSSKLRAPAVSRLQKIHNTKVSLEALQEAGVSLDTGLRGGKIEARDIVEGRQEKTLALLWKLIFHFQVCMEVEQLQLQKEVTLLRRELHLRRGRDVWLEMYGPDCGETTDHERLLLQLCQAVCAFYNIRVDNFSMSFSDGRVLCLLVHHYLPELLPVEEICMDTTQSYITNYTGQAGTTQAECPETDKDRLKELLAYEKNNFKLVNQKVLELGTIPPLLCATDMSNTIPDQKVVMATVSYLCARVINLSQKVRAVRIIQAAWRRYHPKPAVGEWTEDVQTATIRLQAAVRGMIVRRSLQTQHKSATTIQAAVRGWTARQQYMKQRQAAIILQQQVRAHLKRKTAQQKYQHVRRATICLQAAVCGMYVRRRQKQAQLAATKIQACWRGHQQLIKYKAIKLATAIIQQRFRAFKLMQEKQQIFRSCKSATIRLQAAVRGMLVRRSLQRQHKSATIIQAAVRGWTARQQYMKQHQAAITLQQQVRAHLARKTAQQNYQNIRRATICLQAAVRGMYVRRRQKQAQLAATKIQACWRGHQLLIKYKAIKLATTIIQQRFRAFKLMQEEQHMYRSLRSATIRLQAAVRGMLVRKSLQRQHKSATIIQAAVRGWTARRQYMKQRQAAIILQQQVRAHLKRKAAQMNYQNTRRATICLQAVVRGMVVRRLLQRQHKSATTIQAAVRGWTARQQYMKQRQAAIILQQQVRAHLKRKTAQQKYQHVRRATMRLQAAVRGMIVRRSLQRQHKSATTIQTAVRRWTARQQYIKKRQAAIILQQQVRAHLKRKTAQQKYQNIRRATICLQAAVRGMLVRKSLQRQHKSATTIQTAVRGWTARQQYMKQRQAAVVLQLYIRAHLKRKTAQQKYQHVRRATICLQAAVRGMLVRKSLQRQHKSATTIQTAVRGWTARQQYVKQRQAAVVLQLYVRAHLKRKTVQQNYQNIRRATICLQAAVRGMYVRRRQKQAQLAATKIQACWRGHQLLIKYKAIKLAATIIQQRFRAFKLMQEKQQIFRSCKSAAIRLQAAVRGMIVRKSLQRQHKSATVIQTAVRGWTARQQYMKQRQAAIILQQQVRAHLARKTAQQKYQHIRGATIRLQAGIRGFLARRQLMKWIHASTVIQASFRCFLQRRHYLCTRAAVCRLQAAVRGWTARRTYQQVRVHHRAAVVIQSTYRGFATRKVLQHWRAEQQRRLLHFSAAAYHHLAAVRLQRCYRRYLVWQKAKQQLKALITIQASVRAWLQRKHYLQLRQAVCKLQAAVRYHQKQHLDAAVVLQSHFRMYLAKKLMIQRKKAVITMQAIWRGRHVRKNIKNKRIRIARAKILAAQRAATEDKKLCNMTATALNLLLKYKHLSTILDALRSMEVVTRLSAVCCERLVQGGAVQVIYTLIQSCNRSLPCQEIIKYSISILLNLAKNPATVAAAVVQEGGVETLVSLMAIYREKDDVIFGQTCLLLTLFCNNAAYQKEVLNMPSVTQKLQSLYRLVKRKAGMSRNKQRMGSQEDKRRTSTALVQMVHHIKPAWILRKDNMLDVPDPLQAVQLVLVTLDL